mmetsp:Transcript_37546/g.82165  ORF Transcript_37546/g.82165 Transcript_37546/m.82165 type:complete len:402 (-) Transcript_37546:242-1447(-)|eukprot:CAMPEP_0204310032 /NCGR_PEP_ID=MMETSP0469-20131031/1460_1 /ASSEMBLY_ACC=CAM_ASM_000384 /TAXON_ID=2969 /ORGANISM="Oxyrrhis marina" /LENGTH=401 /DNA_ID=CAMNT_0051289737 /DNA_START=1 /DNA_END=1206 /DNA_ORIENTATION=+
MAEGELSGLAKQVREADGAEQFDLAGYSQQRVQQFAQAAFSSPLPRTGVQLTFVVGGGKQVRQKYDALLPRWFSDALTAVGFAEDRGASKECPKTFKHQHDTGKNLIYLHVFPPGEDTAAAGEEEEEDDGAPTTVEAVLLRTELAQLQAACAARSRTYTSKKRCLKFLKEAKVEVAGIEAKMAARGALTPEEEQKYEEATEVDEKIKWLQGEMQQQVDAGRLTEREKSELVGEMEGKKEELEKQKEAAQGSAKKVERIEAALATVDEMVAKVRAAAAFPGVPPSASADLRPLYAKLKPLEVLQKRGGQYSIAELKLMGEIDEIKGQIETYEEWSREIFEEDEELRVRLNALKAAAKAKAKAKSASAWSAPVRRPVPSSRGRGGGYGGTGGAFSALANSDSD